MLTVFRDRLSDYYIVVSVHLIMLLATITYKISITLSMVTMVALRGRTSAERYAHKLWQMAEVFTLRGVSQCYYPYCWDNSHDQLGEEKIILVCSPTSQSITEGNREELERGTWKQKFEQRPWRKCCVLLWFELLSLLFCTPQDHEHRHDTTPLFTCCRMDPSTLVSTQENSPEICPRQSWWGYFLSFPFPRWYYICKPLQN